jgi:hypothetical protein
LSRVCRHPLRLRLPAPVGFTKSSMMASAFWRGGTVLACACSLATGMISGLSNAPGSPVSMPDRRFPPPWSIDEWDACFVVRETGSDSPR